VSIQELPIRQSVSLWPMPGTWTRQHNGDAVISCPRGHYQRIKAEQIDESGIVTAPFACAPCIPKGYSYFGRAVLEGWRESNGDAG